jgi:hypothetical protein
MREYQENMGKWKESFTNWQKDREIASRILGSLFHNEAEPNQEEISDNVSNDEE